MQKQMAAGGAASGGLGGIFSAKAGSMFSWFDDMTTPFKGALDSIVSATPLRLFAAPSAAPAAAPAAAAASTKGAPSGAHPNPHPNPSPDPDLDPCRTNDGTLSRDPLVSFPRRQTNLTLPATLTLR